MTATAPAITKPAAQTRMLKFYDLGEALEIAREWLLEPDHQQALIDAEGDLDALPELKTLLDEIETDFAAKAENVALMVREFSLTADAQKAEAERLRNLSRTAAASAEGLKTYLRIWLLRLNIKKIDGTRAKPRVQANNPAVKCVIEPEQLSQLHALESPFIRKVVTPAAYTVDTDAVLLAWKAAEGSVGKMPDVGETDYHAKRAAWEAKMDEALRAAGVPVGISVERGHHVRIG